MSYYIATLAIFFCSYAIAALALNMQYGLTGTINLAFVMFFALGAYVAGVVAIGSQNAPIAQELGEKFAFGLNLSMPYPLGMLAAFAAGAAVALPVGFFLKRSLRDDFGALATIAIFLVAFTLAGSITPAFNGYNGIAGVPAPFSETDPSTYTVVSFAWLLGAYLFVTLLTRSPYGRRMRAVRERPEAAAALGKDVFRTRLTVFVVSNGLAALAGAVLVLYVSAWSPLSWQLGETLVVFSSIVLGGRGNNLGAVLGALIVGVVLQQAVLFLPSIPEHPNLIPGLQWVITAALTILFLWFWPAGLIPERKTNWIYAEPLRAQLVYYGSWIAGLPRRGVNLVRRNP